MRGSIVKIALLAFLFACIASISAVYASWQYVGVPATAVHTQLGCSVSVFEYPPEQVLPGGGAAVAPMGENHLKLINNLLNEPSYGLNASKKPIIHNLLEVAGSIVYSNQQVTSGNLKHIMPDFSEETEKLYFVIVSNSSTEYIAYTLLESDTMLPIDTYVPVYRTVLTVENGKWVAKSSWGGYAKVNSPGIVGRAIDITTWVSDKHD